YDLFAQVVDGGVEQALAGAAGIGGEEPLDSLDQGFSLPFRSDAGHQTCDDRRRLLAVDYEGMFTHARSPSPMIPNRSPQIDTALWPRVHGRCLTKVLMPQSYSLASASISDVGVGSIQGHLCRTGTSFASSYAPRISTNFGSTASPSISRFTRRSVALLL